MNYKLKSYFVPRLVNYPKLHFLGSKLFDAYSKLTSFNHILPNFYIIGGQKCGTTSMFEYLSKHPSVFPAAAKDIRFYDKYFHKGQDWYKTYFPSKTEETFNQLFHKNSIQTVDATERYLEHPLAAIRIKKITPNAKFIILLRNPIDRAFSHYMMNVDRNMESLSFEESLLKEHSRIDNKLEKMQNDSSFYDDNYFRYGYTDRSIYVTKLKRWLSIFSREQFLIIQSEEFLEKPDLIYKQTIEFLGLKKWTLNNFKQFKKRDYKIPQMKPETRENLIKLFEPHNQQLYNLLGKKFNWDE
jgi:hypothetical protein